MRHLKSVFFLLFCSLCLASEQRPHIGEILLADETADMTARQASIAVSSYKMQILNLRKKLIALKKKNPKKAFENFLQYFSDEYLKNYQRDHSKLYDIVQSKSGNETSQAKLLISVLEELDFRKIKDDGALGVLKCAEDKIFPVYYYKKKKSAINIISNEIMYVKDLTCPIYEPEILIRFPKYASKPRKVGLLFEPVKPSETINTKAKAAPAQVPAR